MHLFDIEDAVSQADLHGLRRAFALLVDYPHRGHVEAARVAPALANLFDRVTLALELDYTEMPEQLCQSIARVTSVEMEPAATFAHGAIIASEFRARWHGLFLDHSKSSHAA